jgi:hypothetical protein
MTLCDKEVRAFLTHLDRRQQPTHRLLEREGKSERFKESLGNGTIKREILVSKLKKKKSHI